MTHRDRPHLPLLSSLGRGSQPGRLVAAVLLSAIGTSAWARSSGAAPGEAATDSETLGQSAGAPSAAAPSKELLQEAGEHYSRGLGLYGDGDHALAAIEFDRAYALVADYRVLYNIGQVRIQLNHYAKARRALERYLEAGGNKIDAERREHVRHDLEMLAVRTGTLRVETNVVGADISVDGERVGSSPLTGPLLLDAGDHRVLVRKTGYTSADSQLTLVGGDETSTRLDLLEERAAPAERVIVQKSIDPKSDRSTWLWTTWSATGAFAVSGAVIGGFGLKTANDLDRQRADPDATRGQLDSTQRRARTLLVLGDVLGGAAVVSGGVALFLTLTNRSEPEATPAKHAASHVDVALGPNWLGLKGAF